MTKAYCFKCNKLMHRKKGEWEATEIQNETQRTIQTKTGVKHIAEGTCQVCGAKLVTMIKGSA